LGRNGEERGAASDTVFSTHCFSLCSPRLLW